MEQVRWHLWIGRARHPGPSTCPFAIEVFNVGRWLTHGDLSLEAQVDFVAVVEHGFFRVGFVVGGPGSGVRVWLLFGRRPLRTVSMPTFATAHFKGFFDNGLAIRCMLPLSAVRFMHLVGFVWLSGC